MEKCTLLLLHAQSSAVRFPAAHVSSLLKGWGERAPENRENLTKMDKLTQDSAKILVKELHLCILRHTYRVDNIRHNYDTLEDLL
jgi:hypothetical protein